MDVSSLPILRAKIEAIRSMAREMPGQPEGGSHKIILMAITLASLESELAHHMRQIEKARREAMAKTVHDWVGRFTYALTGFGNPDDISGTRVEFAGPNQAYEWPSRIFIKGNTLDQISKNIVTTLSTNSISATRRNSTSLTIQQGKNSGVFTFPANDTLAIATMAATKGAARAARPSIGPGK